MWTVIKGQVSEEVTKTHFAQTDMTSQEDSLRRNFAYYSRRRKLFKPTHGKPAFFLHAENLKQTELNQEKLNFWRKNTKIEKLMINNFDGSSFIFPLLKN